MAQGFEHLAWSLEQAMIVGGLGAAYFLVPVAGLVGVMIWKRPHGSPQWLKVAPLLLLTFAWMLVGLWGGWFRRGETPNPGWVEWPPTIIAISAVLLAGVIALRAKGVRVFSVAFSVINLYLLAMCLALTSMSLTGAYL